MALIPYPDVPDFPGVPAIPRLPNTVTGFIGGQTALLNASQSTPESPDQWQIVDQNGVALLTPDSVIDLEYRGEMDIPDYPMEAGSFASYNKVYVPFVVHATVACNGHGAMTRPEFLNAIESLRSNQGTSLAPVNVVTPDRVYGPCNLVHADYRREARNGVSLILARLWFKEIRIYGVAVSVTAAPSGAPQTNIGQAAPVSPSVQQQSAYSAAGVNSASGYASGAGATGSW